MRVMYLFHLAVLTKLILSYLVHAFLDWDTTIGLGLRILTKKCSEWYAEQPQTASHFIWSHSISLFISFSFCLSVNSLPPPLLFTLFPCLPCSLSFSPPSLTFTQSLQSYWPWFLLICILHFSFLGIWRWGTFPSLSEFTAISLCVFSEGLGYEIHIKYPLIPHYPTDKITMIMRQKF